MAATPAIGYQNVTAKTQQAKETTATTLAGAAASVVLAESTVATSATTGVASALPTDPAGYVEVIIGGDLCKIPYYNA